VTFAGTLPRRDRRVKLGLIGKGWVEQIKRQDGSRFVARWNAFVVRDDIRQRVKCGALRTRPESLTRSGLKSLQQAEDSWDKVRWQVFSQHHSHPTSALKKVLSRYPKGHADMTVDGFIKFVYEPRRQGAWEDNCRINRCVSIRMRHRA